jgi:hypothetical protein
MVGGHVVDRLASEYSRAVERATVLQQEGKTQIVSGGRYRAAAAASELVRLRAIAHALRLTRQRIARQTLGEAMDALRWTGSFTISRPSS